MWEMSKDLSKVLNVKHARVFRQLSFTWEGHGRCFMYHSAVAQPQAIHAWEKPYTCAEKAEGSFVPHVCMNIGEFILMRKPSKAMCATSPLPVLHTLSIPKTSYCRDTLHVQTLCLSLEWQFKSSSTPKNWHRSHKGALDPQKLKLQMIFGNLADAENLWASLRAVSTLGKLFFSLTS